MSQLPQILACRIRKALYSLYLATENAPAPLTLNCPPFVISGVIVAREEACAISEEGPAASGGAVRGESRIL